MLVSGAAPLRSTVMYRFIKAGAKALLNVCLTPTCQRESDTWMMLILGGQQRVAEVSE